MYMKTTLLTLLSHGSSCLASEKPASGRESIEHIILRRPKFTRGISIIVRSPEVEDFGPLLGRKPEDKKSSSTPPANMRSVVGGLMVQSPSTDEEIDLQGIYAPWYFTGEPQTPKPAKKEGKGL
jgi:hypothetical protein